MVRRHLTKVKLQRFHNASATRHKKYTFILPLRKKNGPEKFRLLHHEIILKFTVPTDEYKQLKGIQEEIGKLCDLIICDFEIWTNIVQFFIFNAVFHY